MKKIISFSLFNDNKKYLEGILCNIEISKIIYPEWICRVYYDNTVPEEYIEKLKKYEKIEMIDMSDSGIYNKMSWRFLAIDDSDVEILLSRDADSRISYREKTCVDIFLNSNFILHDLRDHSYHYHFMGGMFGIKKHNFFIFKDEILKYNAEHKYGEDEKFLKFLFEKFIPNDLILKHDGFYDIENFPVKNKVGEHFIGEVFDENNNNKPYNTIFY